jgi:hypothetical protein
MKKPLTMYTLIYAKDKKDKLCEWKFPGSPGGITIIPEWGVGELPVPLGLLRRLGCWFFKATVDLGEGQWGGTTTKLFSHWNEAAFLQ